MSANDNGFEQYVKRSQEILPYLKKELENASKEELAELVIMMTITVGVAAEIAKEPMLMAGIGTQAIFGGERMDKATEVIVKLHNKVSAALDADKKAKKEKVESN